MANVATMAEVSSTGIVGEGKFRIEVIDKNSTVEECEKVFRVLTLEYPFPWDPLPIEMHELLDSSQEIYKFLLHGEGSIIGLCILRKAESRGRMSWEEMEQSPLAEWLLTPLADTNPVWELVALLIDSNSRGQGLSKLLLCSAAHHLNTDLDHIGVTGFNTEEEARYCRHLWPDGIILTRCPDVKC